MYHRKLMTLNKWTKGKPRLAVQYQVYTKIEDKGKTHYQPYSRQSRNIAIKFGQKQQMLLKKWQILLKSVTDIVGKCYRYCWKSWQILWKIELIEYFCILHKVWDRHAESWNPSAGRFSGQNFRKGSKSNALTRIYEFPPIFLNLPLALLGC